MAKPPRLGRFQLLEPIAQGGMASVWKAVHRDRRVPAAVKVLDARANRGLAESLRAEIRTMARLEHPHIVGIFDQGVVDERAARAAGGAIAAGSPWVAMEYVRGVTLGELYRDLDWPTLAVVLTQLLDALAHAHAAGVIHRDLKLSNVLFGKNGVKLMDFGVAYAVRLHEERGDVPLVCAGTPRYMPPEQFDERAGLQGPWTDLFALGVLVWRLSSTTSPFPECAKKAREAKERGHFLPFIPRFPLPSGFPGWCARLLCARPEDRFANAADAAWHLNEIVERTIDAPPGEPTELVLPPTDPPPPPPTWRNATPWRRPMELVGCGLRLFGLRDAPFIGRYAMRDRMWSDLIDVHRTGMPKVVVLRGPSGYGKTCLANWFARRAEELGAAVVLRTQWDDPIQPGLAGLVARRLRCLGQPREMVQRRIRHHLRGTHDAPPGEALRLMRLLVPTGPVDPEAEDDETLSAEDRFGLVTRVIRRSIGPRTGVVCFDDAHANPESFRYALQLLEDAQLPVLLVLTVQEEALAGKTASSIALEQLCAHRRTRTLHVGRLDFNDQVELIRGLLSVEPKLARQIARRTEGNPLFASQLLEEWVSRDLFVLGPEGFRLRDGLTTGLPNSLRQVWTDRVQTLIDETSPSYLHPLELAATLGIHVDLHEWSRVCEHAGTSAPSALLDALVARRLAIRQDGGWNFIHGMLREAILERAATEGRLTTHHRHVAEALRGRTGVAVRVAQHLLEAKVGMEAVDPLEAGAEEAIRTGDLEEAMRLLRAREQAMQSALLPRHDARWGRGWLAFAEVLARLDRWEEAADYAEMARREAARHGWARVEVEACMLLVENRAVTDRRRAKGLLERAYKVAMKPGNADILAPVCLLAAQVLRRSGDLEGSLQRGKQALTHVLRSGGIRRARVEIEIAQTAIKLGHVEEAERHIRRARHLAEQRHHPFDLAVCAYLEGNLGRVRGDLDAAERGYREATDRFAALGDANAWTTRAHLGIVLAERGAFEEARQLFELVLRSRSQLGDLLAHLGSLLCSAHEENPGFDTHVKAVERFVARGWCDPLAAKIVEDAARRASRAGYPQRARLLLGLSHRQRARLAREA